MIWPWSIKNENGASHRMNIARPLKNCWNSKSGDFHFELGVQTSGNGKQSLALS